MSHFDDEMPLFLLPLTSLIGIAAAIAFGIWAYSEDAKSRATCEKAGEAYIDSREGYTLCEQDGGGVVKR